LLQNQQTKVRLIPVGGATSKMSRYMRYIQLICSFCLGVKRENETCSSSKRHFSVSFS